VDTLAALVKAFVPGSFPFLLLVSGIGVLLLFSSRTMAWGRRLLAALLIAYLTLSLPVVARWLESGLHPAYAPIVQVSDAKGARTIVVLGNGVVSYSDERRAVHALTRRTAMNVLEGARLYELLKPARLIVSGGAPAGAVARVPEAAVMAEALTTLGVPRTHVVLETASHNTRDQSVLVRRMLRPGERIILVTTPIHMRRALALFAQQGCDVAPSPASIEYAPDSTSWSAQFRPSLNTLRMSELVVYERLALVKEKWKSGEVAK